MTTLVAGDMEAGRMAFLFSRNLQASQQDPSDTTHVWDGCISSCTGCPPSVSVGGSGYSGSGDQMPGCQVLDQARDFASLCLVH